MTFFSRWLADVPLSDSVERKLAPLLQFVLIALAATSLLSITERLIRTWPAGLPPNTVIITLGYFAVLLFSLWLVRHGRFQPAVWVLLIVIFAIIASGLLTINLDEMGEVLLACFVPLTIAGLLLNRLGLLITLAASSILVFVAAESITTSGGMPMTTLYVLYAGLISFLLDLFRNTLRRELTLSLARSEELERARADLQVTSNELAALNERLTTTLRSIGDAVITTDAQGRIMLINGIAQQLTGWTQDEAEGQPLTRVFQIFNQHTRETVENPVERVLREGVIVGLANDTILVARDGREIPIDDSGAPIRQKNGNLLGVVLVFRDISERYRAQQEREEIAARLNGIIASAMDAIITVDEDQRIMVFNQSAEEAFGLQVSQALGQPLDRLIPPRFQERHRNHIRTFGQTGVTTRSMTSPGALLGRRASGEEFPIEATISQVIIGGRKIFTVILRDITERKRAEEHRRLLYELTVALSETLTREQVADVIIDRAFAMLGSHVGTVFILSEDGQSLEMLNMKQLPPETVEAYRKVPLDYPAPLTDAVREGKLIWIADVETYLARYPHFSKQIQQNGSQSTACVPLIASGRVLGGISLSFPQPRTETVEEWELILTLAHHCAQAFEHAFLYEAEATARREAEAANELKIRFLGMISHELRTPLTSIKGFLSSLLAEDVEWSPEQQREFLNIAESESDKLTALVEQLLEVSRLQAGTLSVTVRHQKLGDILSVAMPQLRTICRNHQLQITAQEDALILADEQRLAQVLVNLVDNAAKYSPTQTLIAVSGRAVDGYVQIDVRDTGPGIHPDDREIVFEAFRQVKLTSAQRGAGLGLAICKGLVEAHGGRIWIEDTDGPGTLISFTVPSTST